MAAVFPVERTSPFRTMIVDTPPADVERVFDHRRALCEGRTFVATEDSRCSIRDDRLSIGGAAGAS